MPATPMHVELLVIGFGASMWLGFFLSWLFGAGWLTDSLTTLQSYALLVSAFVLSIAYSLGILVDKFSKRVLENPGGEQESYYPELAHLIQSENELAVADLTYVRSKVRILRASVINAPLITLFAGVYLWTRGSDNAGAAMSIESLVISILAAGLILTILSYVMYRYNTKLFKDRVSRWADAAQDR